MKWHLKGEPRLAQVEALRRASGHDKWGHYLDTGLGKTEVALHEFIESGLDQHVVICPNSLKRSWADAIFEWCPALSLGVTIWPEPPDPDTTTFILNYEMLIYDHSFSVVQEFMERAPTFMTIDEGHRTKSFNAKTTKMVHALAPLAAMRRELTATPMVNSVMDLWSQLRYLGQLQGVNPYSFRNRFAIMGGFMGKQVMGIKPERLQELNSLLDICSFRASKNDWSDLPKRIQMPPREFEMTAKQRELYKQMLDEFLVMIKDEAVVAEMVISQLLKLQQISRGFVIKEDGEAYDFLTPNVNPALRALRDMLEDIPGKVLIFCHFRHSVTTVAGYLSSSGHAPVVLMSGMGEADEARHEFNENPVVRCAVIQSATGSEGLTLLGGSGKDRCASSVFYENSYSLGTRIQAEGRNHRFGQDQMVTYFDLTCSPIDRAIIRALQKKTDLVRSVAGAVR